MLRDFLCGGNNLDMRISTAIRANNVALLAQLLLLKNGAASGMGLGTE